MKDNIEKRINAVLALMEKEDLHESRLRELALTVESLIMSYTRLL